MGCKGCGMEGLWDGGVVGWRGCGMEGLWDGGVVGWRGCGMESKSLLSSATNACFCYGLFLNLQFGRKL